MKLASMRFKTFVWPHNPETYQISFVRSMPALKMPGGGTRFQDMGLCHRVFSGRGVFSGADAYQTFKVLASLMYDGTPGPLVHPVWQATTARLVSLQLNQEPQEDYVSYAFVFYEDTTPAVSLAPQVTTVSGVVTVAAANKNTAKKTVTIQKGDTLWAVAQANGVALDALIKANPQIKNPNLIYPGDKITIP